MSDKAALAKLHEVNRELRHRIRVLNIALEAALMLLKESGP